MGKTVNGAVWLHEDFLPAYDYWQFWRNTDDRDVGKFLRLFTELSEVEIVRLESLKDAQINEAKIVLANEATRLCRGEDAAIAAAETARKTFTEGAAGDDLPTHTIHDGNISVVDALVALNFATSKKDARRLISGRGVRIEDVVIEDENAALNLSASSVRISSGKKKHGVLNFV
jgi:tyrosyl-tRNA synthetase